MNLRPFFIGGYRQGSVSEAICRNHNAMTNNNDCCLAGVRGIYDRCPNKEKIHPKFAYVFSAKRNKRLSDNQQLAFIKRAQALSFSAANMATYY
jgi:hypothetical protein